MGISVSFQGRWKLYWGGMPLPQGAKAIGTVTRDGLDTGALLRLRGKYVQGNAGSVRALPQHDVKAALSVSRAAAALGSMRSPAKAAAARKNGKLGGRPRHANREKAV